MEIVELKDAKLRADERKRNTPDGEVIKPVPARWEPALPAHDHSVFGARFHWE